MYEQDIQMSWEMSGRMNELMNRISFGTKGRILELKQVLGNKN